MSNKAKKNTNKRLYVAAAVVLFLLLGIIFIKRNSVKNIFTDDISGTSPSISDTVKDKNVNVVNYGPSNPTDNDQINDQKKNADQSKTPVNTDLNATITNTRVVNSLAQISVLVSGASSGSCTLTLSKSGLTDVTKTVSIVIRNGITSCEDFNIPVSSLSNGNWGVKVVLESNQSKSKPAESTLQIGT